MLEIETAVADTHRFSCFGYNNGKSFIDINVVKFNINVDYWTFMFGVIRLEIAVFMTNYVCLFVCLFHGDDQLTMLSGNMIHIPSDLSCDAKFVMTTTTLERL